MTPDSQFKKLCIFLILIAAFAVFYNLPSTNETIKTYQTSVTKKVVTKKIVLNNDVVVKEEENVFWTKFSHDFNPKKYWISGNIKINPLSTYNMKTKEEVYTFRKYYVNKSIFKNKNYVPSEKVFGQIKDNAQWLGIKAFSCIGPNTLCYKSMTKDSKFINNPNILVGIDYFDFPRKTIRCTDEDYLMPKSLSFSKDTSSFILTYKIPERAKDRRFKLVGLNARDLGFLWGFCKKTNNIAFLNPVDNISKNLYEFKDAIRIDASCGIKDGCNNNLAYQEELFFNVENSPATFELKLWKARPDNVKSPADINFTIILE